MSTVMNNIYNNYLTTYAPKSLTQYDTHKKSELRSVYNSIVKLNKESPLYLPTTDKDTQQYAVQLKENARELHNTIAAAGGLDDALLSKKSAYSSDESVISANYIGPKELGEEIPPLEMTVSALATSQENLGLFLPEGKFALPADTYSFDVSINEMNYEFQFTTNGSESNRDIQERLNKLINNANIGIHSEIVEEDGRSSLKLTSDNTGVGHVNGLQFSITDDKTSKRSGSVEYLGIDYITREPSNAAFTVNGEEHTTASNRFTLGKMFELELNSITEEDATVSIGLKADTESLADNISHLIGSYNSFMQAANSYLESQSRSKLLVGEMRGIAVSVAGLQDLGINMNDDGTMSINREQLRSEIVQSEDLNTTFSSIKELSNALLRKSTQVSLNPMNYVQKTVVAYKNPGHNYTSPYTASAYSGMMFNDYC